MARGIGNGILLVRIANYCFTSGMPDQVGPEINLPLIKAVRIKTVIMSCIVQKVEFNYKIID